MLKNYAVIQTITPYTILSAIKEFHEKCTFFK